MAINLPNTNLLSLGPGGSGPMSAIVEEAQEYIHYSLGTFGEDGLLTSLDFGLFTGVEMASENLVDGDMGMLRERNTIDDEDIMPLFYAIETVEPPSIVEILIEEILIEETEQFDSDSGQSPPPGHDPTITELKGAKLELSQPQFGDADLDDMEDPIET